jgi:hypothetical protein
MPDKVTRLFVVTRHERPQVEIATLTAEEASETEQQLTRLCNGLTALHVWVYELKASTMNTIGLVEHAVPLYMKAHYFPDEALEGYIEDFLRHVDEFTDEQAQEIVQEALEKLQTKLQEIQNETSALQQLRQEVPSEGPAQSPKEVQPSTTTTDS